jgi:hypothetical protein
MTEAEWLAATDPETMLEEVSGVISDRKIRLFAVASVQELVYVERDERSRRALEVAERSADESASPEERVAAEHKAMEMVASLRPGGIGWSAVRAAKWTVAERLSPRAVATHSPPPSPKR